MTPKTLLVLPLLTLATLSGQVDQPATSWTPTAKLTEARSNSCAIRLSDGRILVAGGTGIAGDLDSTELYLPEGVFLPAARMNATRSRHTCTLLAGGRVLVVGGDAAGTAEIYDPQADTWQAMAGTGQVRGGHTATLLQDKRVLIAGGASPDGPLDSLEIFDADKNTLTTASAKLAAARITHAAISLADGRVLLIAGRGVDAPLGSTEIFNPADDTISSGPSLQTARTGHSATLLDDGRILVAGGFDGDKDLDTAEIYDPAQAQFQLLDVRMHSPRRDHLALLIPGNGGILLAGGLSKDQTLAGTDLFLPLENTFLALGDLTLPRSAMAGAAVSEGVILATGGVNADGPQSACGLLFVPALQFAKTGYHPDETITASGTNFSPNFAITLSLDLFSNSGGVAAKGRLITSSVTPTTPPGTIILRVGFPAVPILATGGIDAGKTARLTAQSSNGLTAVASVPIKVATSITLSLPAVEYEGFNATFLAQINRAANPFPLTGNFSLSVQPGTTSITDGTSNTIIIGAQQPATVNLNTSGTSSILQNSFTNLPAIPLTVTANYAGDAVNEPSSATTIYRPVSKTPQLQFSLNPSAPQVGIPFTISAAVQAQTASPAHALNGSVGFFLSGFSIGSPQTVSSSTSAPAATVNRPFTALTTDQLAFTATYSGDTFFRNAQSTQFLVRPQKAPTTASFVNPPLTFACSQSTPLTIRLSFPPTLGLSNRLIGLATSSGAGSLAQLNQSAGTLIPDPQVPGQAIANITTLIPARTTTIQALFSGDSLLLGSGTSVTAIAVAPSPVTVQFTSIPTAPVTGPFTLSVQVTPSSCNIAPSGNVEFLDGGNVIAVKPIGGAVVSADGSVQFVNSLTSIALSLPVGTHSIQARYSGDLLYQPATSSPVLLTFQ